MGPGSVPATPSRGAVRTAVHPSRAFWRRVRRHRAWIPSLAAMCGLLAAWMGLSAPPLYEAEATLLVGGLAEAASFGQATVGAGPVAPLASPQDPQTVAVLLQSRSLSESVSERLGAWYEPGPGQHQPIPWLPRLPAPWDVWLGDLLGNVLPGVLPEASPPSALGETHPRAAMAQAIGRRLKAEVIPGSRVIRLSFRDPDPELAARVVNTFADSIFPLARQTPGPSAPPGVANARRDSVSAQVQGLAERLRKSREVRDSLQDLQERLASPGETRGADLAAHPLLAGNALIQPLRAALLQEEREQAELAKRYGPLHPKLVEARSRVEAASAMLEAETRRAAEGLLRGLAPARTEVETLEADLRSLLGALPGQSDPNPSPVEPAAPGGEALASASADALAGARPLAPADAQVLTAGQVVDHAQVPKHPIAPKVAALVGTAALGGLGAGLLIALLAAWRDQRLADPRDVEDRLGVPVLTAVPRMGRRGGRTTPLDRMVVDQPAGPFAEAIRALRSRLLLSTWDPATGAGPGLGLGALPGVVLVTSASPGEGKTTVAINLALALGRLGKVLLVDGDLRGAGAAARLGVPADAPGLADLVAGKATEDACIRPLAGGVDLLCPGRPPADPLDVLSAPRLAEVLRGLGQGYACVVLDGAELHATSDALLLARLSDAVVLVIRADATRLPLAQRSVELLGQIGAPLAGALLNGCGKRHSPHPRRAPYPARAASEVPCV